MKFLADMPISPRTAEFLRKRGYDIVHLRERGLQKATDEQVIELARNEKRIILTMDLDFPHLIALGRLSLPSIILFRIEDERPDNVNLLLEQNLISLQGALESGAIVVFEEKRIRIHSLPL